MPWHAPQRLESDDFVLEPLGPRHNDADHADWSASIDHIRRTPGFRPELWGGDEWPYPMTLEDNRSDLEQHAAEFVRGEAFAYTVLDPVSRDVIGCVYLDPDLDGAPAAPGAAFGTGVARCRMWVRADRADLDGALEAAVRTWLSGHEWNLVRVRYPGRD